MMKSILERFLKPYKYVVSNATNFHSVDVTEDKNMCTYAKVDIGFSAQKILKELVAQKKVTDRQAVEFGMERRSFLDGVVK